MFSLWASIAGSIEPDAGIGTGLVGLGLASVNPDLGEVHVESIGHIFLGGSDKRLKTSFVEEPGH
jgi:hypothetical protein